MTTDVNIRIDKSTHKKLKVTAARYDITLKDLLAIIAVNKGFEHTLQAVIRGA